MGLDGQSPSIRTGDDEGEEVKVKGKGKVGRVERVEGRRLRWRERCLLARCADDLERHWRMGSGGRLYSAPRTCRVATGAE